ncbi:HAD hydrolase-like protein [Naasia aerilata]|uniref:5'-nucleotidase n=1 Tax=Naasia aerilata TaxID=1162966 RepID=A0ABN6XKN9_9MICO|nr:HAD hydrolase-like protein [Naasia aerilata]BDZ45414.1 5'-nucleotidase [Naasia aerilata]
MSGWSCVLFDLDGTIADSAAGITSTLAHTLERMGKPVPTPAQLVAFVGPPIMDGFADLGLTEAESHQALALYRAQYQERGAFDSSVYPGIEDALRAIASSGLPIALATSKPERQARRMLDHYGFSHFFTFIGGASEDEVRSEKADVVAYVLENLSRLGVDTSRAVMIGDRVHDVEGAAANGVPTIFADWGYGTEAERAGSIAVAHSPQDLPALVIREQAA